MLRLDARASMILGGSWALFWPIPVGLWRSYGLILDDGPFNVFQWTSAVVEALRAALDALNEADPLEIEWN